MGDFCRIFISLPRGSYNIRSVLSLPLPISRTASPPFPEELLQRFVPRLAHDKVAEACRCRLGIERERILALFFQQRVVTIELPVACFHRTLFFLLRLAHVDAVVDARRVRDDEGRTRIGFRFLHRFQELALICAHRNACNIDVAIRHRNCAEVFFLDLLTGRRKFRNGAGRRGFACLSARVGVYLRVEHEDIHVFARSEDMVETP